MNRILVIRGGAIGDFVLTLPAIKLLREKFPKAHLEILGYKPIAAVAEKRFYANAVRSLESGLLAGFFARDSKLPADLIEYFASFDLIVSYLFDPDRIFEENLRRCRIGHFVTGPSKLDNREQAALQLARPLETLGLHLEDPAARIYPSEEDRESGRHYLGNSKSFIALHPGSGSETKNWPIDYWLQLGDLLLAGGYDLLVVVGEAEEQRLEKLELAWASKRVRFVRNRPLPELAAILEGSVFVGHDSGISHVAAAAGARCLLLFGWTDPAIWAPANKQVKVLRAPEGNLSRLAVETVFAAIETLRPLTN